MEILIKWLKGNCLHLPNWQEEKIKLLLKSLSDDGKWNCLIILETKPKEEHPNLECYPK